MLSSIQWIWFPCLQSLFWKPQETIVMKAVWSQDVKNVTVDIDLIPGFSKAVSGGSGLRNSP